MQTGYDNFWMYQNSRHEPVLNLQKNDNYICPVITDNYKQIQNGGYPSNNVMPLNNVASSCQNGQYSTGPQCMWPSSIYSLPYANEFHSQMFSTQTSDFNYASQPLTQSKTGVRYSSAPQKNRGNNQEHNTTRFSQNRHYTDTETARIRVKDVYTLNGSGIYNSVLDSSLVHTQKNKQHEYPLNFSTNNCNRTCDFETNLPVAKHLPSSYVQSKQPCLGNEQKFLQHSAALYDPKAQLPSESQFQSNGSIQKKSDLQLKGSKTKPSLIRQLLSCNNQNQNQEEDQNKLCNRLKRNKRVTSEPKKPNHLSYLKSNNSHIGTERTNIINYCDSSELNEKLTSNSLNNNNNFGFVENQDLANYPGPDQALSLSQISSVQDLKEKQMCDRQSIATSNASSFPNYQINDIENNLVTITIPLTGQSTYLNPVDSSSINGNSSLSLQTSLESNSEIIHGVLNKKNPLNYNQDNDSYSFSLTQTGQFRQKSNTSFSGNHVYNSPQLIPKDCDLGNSDSAYKNMMTPPRNAVASTQSFQKEPDDELKHQDQKALTTSKNCSKISSGNFSTDVCDGSKIMNEVIVNSSEAELIFQDETDLNDRTIKQEICNLEINSSSTQLENLIVDQVSEKIKAEVHSENFEVTEQEQELRSSENLSHAKEALPSNSVGDEDIASKRVEERVDYKRICPESVTQKPIPNEWKNSENFTSELEISQSNVRKNENPENNIADQEANFRITEGSYKSKINRDKLDLLIQFLKKDDEVVENKTHKENDHSVSVKKITDCSKKKKENNLNRSRRKLSKTCIVKNKNNSREMVSLVSHKTSRADIQHSPKRSEFIKTEGNFKKKEERKNNCMDNINSNEKPVDVSVNEVKSYNPIQESENEKNLDPVSDQEPKAKSKSVGCQTQENFFEEEKNIMNIMQALQNLKSHFCLSCTLVSPIDSFWINVVSSELRCLNCFKKMTSKTEENILKLKRTPIDDCSSAEQKPYPDEKMQNVNENKTPKLESICNRSKCECASDKSSDSKVNIKEEKGESLNKSTEDKITYVSNEEVNFNFKDKKAEKKDAIRTSNVSRKKSVEEEKKLKVGESEKITTAKEDFTVKTNVLDDSSKLEINTKRKFSVKDDSVLDRTQKLEEKASPVKSRKKSNSEETQGLINTLTIDNSKQLSDSPGKKNASKEEIDSSKARVHCNDNIKKEEKLSSQSGKCTSKEQCTFPKSQMSKGGAEQETKSDSDKPIKTGLLKEEDIAKKDKKQSKDSSHSRKRANSKEFDCHKVRVSEEQMVQASDVKSPSRESLDMHKLLPAEVILKRSTISTDQKAKISKKKYTNPSDDSESLNMSVYKNSEKDKSMESVDQLRKRKKSVEEVIPHKIRLIEEHSKDTKFSKQYSEKSKGSSKADDVSIKNKTPEHSKNSTFDLKSVSRRKKDECFLSKEQSKNDMKKSTESTDKNRRNSTSKENHSTSEHSKNEINLKKNLLSKNKGKEKKQSSEKIQERSHKNLEKNTLEHSSNDDTGHKSGAASKPLKESQKIEKEMKISSPTRIFKKKELHESKRKQKEHSDGKITGKKINEKQSIEVGNNFEKKKNLEQEVFKKQRYDKGKTENTGKYDKDFIRQSKKKKGLECVFGKKRKEDLALKEFRKVCIEKAPSAKILEKLIEKTKKLSWTLLGET